MKIVQHMYMDTLDNLTAIQSPRCAHQVSYKILPEFHEPSFAVTQALSQHMFLLDRPDETVASVLNLVERSHPGYRYSLTT